MFDSAQTPAVLTDVSERQALATVGSDSLQAWIPGGDSNPEVLKAVWKALDCILGTRTGLLHSLRESQEYSFLQASESLIFILHKPHNSEKKKLPAVLTRC